MSELTPRQLDALDRIEQKPELQPFFFRKLKGLKWFAELEKRGFLNPRLNPKPVKSDQEGYFSIPSWPILDYLEQTASELQHPDNIDYADRYMKVIRDVTRVAMVDGASNYRTWWYFAKIIRFIPIKKIEYEDVELFDYWLSDRFDGMLVGVELGGHLLPRLLATSSDNAREIATGLINTLTSLTWEPRRWGTSEELEARLPVKAYHLGKIFGAHARAIGEKLEEVGVSIFRDRLLEIFSKSDKDRYSSIWRPAVEDHEQNRNRDDVENILASAFRDALLGYVDTRAAAAYNYVAELLGGETVLFQRVAIYIVGVYKRQLNGLVRNLIEPKYFQYHYQHEMHHFLQNCFVGFDEEEKKKVLGIIGNIAEQHEDSEVSDGIQEKQKAYIWLRWLSAIRGKGYQPADDLYKVNLAITEREPEHPDFSSYMESGGVGEYSPYGVEELLSRDFDGLVKILKSFKEEGGWKTPTRRGLAKTLKEALKTRPAFFKGCLTDLVDLDFDYLYQLIEGYKELWQEKRYDNWAELFEFCWALLQSEGFWAKGDADQGRPMVATSDWIVGTISDLIRAGTADDETAFDHNLLPMAKQIIVYILANQESESFVEERDAVSVSINSPRGKCIEALINYALRLRRLANKNKKGHDELWVRELQPVFDEQMHRLKEGNLEFVTLLTNYIPNLLYLSRSWTIQQLPILFEKKNRRRWLCAMQGYTYVNHVYAEIYQFLAENGHFRDALDADELESKCKDKIIQNIAIAYIQGDERLNDKEGMLNWLIDRWELEELRELTWFVWTLGRDKNEDIRAKLISLWGRLSRRADLSSEAGKHVLSRLCMWSIFVDVLNKQTMDLLMQSAPYADLEHDAYILVEELKRLVEVYPDQVADIFIRMLESFAPTYQQEDIEHIIIRLYEKGGEARHKANAICDKYVEYGIGFPAEIRARFARS